MFSENAALIKAGFQEQLDKLEPVRQEYAGKVALVEQMVADHDAELKVAEDKGFEEGLKQAGQAGGEGKIYSDAEVNAMLEPLKADIEVLKAAKIALDAKVAELESAVDVTPFDQAHVDAEIEKVSAPLKAQIAQLSLSAEEREKIEESLSKQAADLSKAISDLTPAVVVEPPAPQPEA